MVIIPERLFYSNKERVCELFSSEQLFFSLANRSAMKSYDYVIKHDQLHNKTTCHIAFLYVFLKAREEKTMVTLHCLVEWKTTMPIIMLAGYRSRSYLYAHVSPVWSIFLGKSILRVSWKPALFLMSPQ